MDGIAVIAIKNILMMVSIMAVGFLFARAGIFEKRDEEGLSKVLLNILCPCIILNTFMQEYDSERTAGFIDAVYMTLLMIVLGIAVFTLMYGPRHPLRAEMHLATLLTNCGFVGLPIIMAVVSSQSQMYLSGVILVSTTATWTYGVALCSGKTDSKGLIKMFTSPQMVAIAAGLLIYFLRIPLPSFAKSAISSMSSACTPAAMLIAGSVMYRSDIKSLLRNKNLYAGIFMKLILLPLFMLILIVLFRPPVEVALVLIIASACPTASTPISLSQQYGKDEYLVTGIFTATSVLFIFTLPVCLTLCEMLY